MPEPMSEHKDKQRAQRIRDGVACVYAAIIPALRTRAKELGYALAVHGSMVRDLDLIAVPWVDEAVSDDELATALKDVLGGWCTSDCKVARWPTLDRGKKPHGRVAYTILWGGDDLLQVDLSVTPRDAPTRTA